MRFGRAGAAPAARGAALLLGAAMATPSSTSATSSTCDGNLRKQNELIGRQLIQERERHMGPNVSIFYKQAGGLVITSGQGVYLKDIDGNQYLDCVNNVAVVGHSHPRVVAAGQSELARIQTNGRFLHPVQQRYLRKLLATLPAALDTVYLVNSGSEANELALRLARSHSKATRATHVICLESGYHGNTAALIGVSPYKWSQATDGKNYQPATTLVASLPDGFRGKYPVGQTPLAGELYAAEVEALVSGPEGGVGVFIAEGIVGCGGQIVLPPGYLQRCYRAIRAQGGVCIADEVQTGFGRCGTKFWMFEEHGVVPDIVTMGKPMGESSLPPPSLP
jgi:4-aminobutyrate aminotransferase-like enzyme